MREDAWHAISGRRTGELTARELARRAGAEGRLLNAGSGVYTIGAVGWEEISVDLFEEPLASRAGAVCANVELLPFKDGVFRAVICVGEVLGYYDPLNAMTEFARVLEPGGLLLFDFGSTRSAKRWFTSSYARSASLVTETYNGRPEVLWNYSPEYLVGLMRRTGFAVTSMDGVHTFSALAARCGLSAVGLVLERTFGRVARSPWSSDLVVVSAYKSKRFDQNAVELP